MRWGLLRACRHLFFFFYFCLFGQACLYLELTNFPLVYWREIDELLNAYGILDLGF